MMKKYFKHFTLVVLLSVLSVNLHAQTVYLTEAKKNPFERIVFLDENGGTLRYTAFYQGASPPQGDITVGFSVDPAKAAAYNAKRGSDYKMLPKESYSLGLDSAVIAQGSVSATPGEVTVTGKGYLQESEKYLLPVTVSVKGNLAEADPELSTVYYTMTVVIPIKVTRQQIGQMSPEVKSVFGFGDKYLIVDGGNGELVRVTYTGSGFDEATPVSVPDNLKEMVLLVNFRDHHIIGFYRGAGNGQLWSFPISADGTSVGPLEKVFGSGGYNMFSEIFPYGTNLYCRKPGGELMLYPLTESLEWIFERVGSIGGGFNRPVIFGYGKSLMAVNREGALWKYPILEDGQLSSGKKIGTGWNHYDKILVVGDDLLCVDKEGVVWQIKFQEDGYWVH